MVSVEKDKKGSAYFVSHMRCGYHEYIGLTEDELRELYKELRNVLADTARVQRK